MTQPPSHAPPGYRCPFCAISTGTFDGECLTTPGEVVLKERDVSAVVSLHQFPPLLQASRLLAVSLKRAHGCPGTSTRQHNEPAGNQDVWHYHLHVFPRFEGDDLYRSRRQEVALETRLEQAALLRDELASDA